MKKLLLITLVILLVAGMAVGCAKEATTEEATTQKAATEAKVIAEDVGPITIAFVGPLTGDYAQYGQSFRYSVELAVSDVNAKGGILGRPVKFDVYDDKNSSEEAAAVAEKIVGNDAYCAVIGHFSSGVTMTAAVSYQEAGILHMTASASHPDYSGIGDYMFRNNILITLEAANCLQIAQKDGKKRLGVLKIKSDWGDGAEDALMAAMDEIGPYIDMEIVHMEEFVDGTIDFSSSITKFEQKECDGIVVLGMYNVLAPFALQYEKVNPDMSLYGNGSSYSQELIDIAGKAANGISFPAGMNTESQDPQIKAYVDGYLKLSGGVMPDNMAAQTYDNINMVFAAIEASGTDDRKAIRDQIAAIKYQGVSGFIQFDENGDAVKTQTMFTIVDGKYKEIVGGITLWPDYVDSLK